MVRLLLVDDHELVRAGVRRLLADCPDMEVVGECGTGEEAIAQARALRPDVILLDVNMPGVGGMEATRRIRQLLPETRIIVVTVHVQEPWPSKLLEAGANGYLTKSCAVDEIVNAIRTVMKGEIYLDPEVARALALSRLPGQEASPFDKLSQREMEVLLMVTRGQSIQEISDALCLSPKTVSTYRYRLYEKLGVSNDVELTHLAVRHGLIDLDSLNEQRA
ncbi:MAG: two-component system response regulator UvrY [Gammaproteobacteria bacterium]|nr:MAG: two-component system response regulator UvrY [Gammaproteobacteria bacterium]